MKRINIDIVKMVWCQNDWTMFKPNLNKYHGDFLNAYHYLSTFNDISTTKFRIMDSTFECFWNNGRSS